MWGNEPKEGDTETVLHSSKKNVTEFSRKFKKKFKRGKFHYLNIKDSWFAISVIYL
jgi:hypothetical protein